MNDRPLRPPPLRLFAAESLTVAELGAFAAASPFLRLLGRGDEHPVLVLPGFTADDRSTLPLRWVLRSLGYWVNGWRLGANLGPRRGIEDAMRRNLEALHERREAKVSLVGWSLGGLYARQLAREVPEAVRQVITLGSPFRFREGDRGRASPLFERINGPGALLPGMDVPEEERPPLTVPATAIYSRTDGVVRWHACIEAEGPLKENVEVRGSHSGLGHNPAVLIAVADRLAQPEGYWAPFRPPPGTARLYPAPVTWRPRAERQGPPVGAERSER